MLLCFVSLIEVYSATSTLAYKNTYYFEPIVRHARFLFIGFCLVLLLHNIPSKHYIYALILVPASILLLFYTLFHGVDVHDTARFISIKGIQFQPSEFGKLACILLVAYMLSKQDRFSPNRSFWIMLFGVGIICALIYPENLSTAVLLFGVCFLLMFIGLVPNKKMLGLFTVLVFFGGLLIFTPKEFSEKYMPDRFMTWQARIERFVAKDADNKFTINDGNYQENHARIAIARGGILGKLPGRSVQRDFLPQAYSDFIYAIVIEEMGLIIGGIGVLMLYVILLFRVGIIARRCEKLFPKYLALGCGLLIVVQALVAMGVAVGLFPVTGQPLPLISRGGTSTVLTCIYFGIILSVSRFGAHMDVVETIETKPEDEDSETEPAAESNDR
jgi:cell division protein FtsW